MKTTTLQRLFRFLRAKLGVALIVVTAGFFLIPAVSWAQNNPPVAVDDDFYTEPNTPLNQNVLANDRDDDGDTMTASLVTHVSHGLLITFESLGSFTYEPDPDFTGEDSFTYVANDGQEESNLATVTITIGNNESPVADANGPYEGTAGIPVQFDGSGSFDLDGTIIIYDWNFGDDTTGTGVTPTHTYAAVGIYDVTLTVADDEGGVGTDSTTAVIDGANTPPVADPNGPYTVTVGIPVQFDGSGSFDLDGTISLYEWDFDGDGTFDFSSATSSITTHPYAVAGTYTARLRVTDNEAGTDTETATVTVLAGVDLDIAKFKVTKKVQLSKAKQIQIKLAVKNMGMVDEPRPAIVEGHRGLVKVYEATMMVSGPIGGENTQFKFPSYTPDATGEIVWRVNIVDDDPDIDFATASTIVDP